MAHFYTAERLPKFIEEIETPSQANKNGKAWPSVTTVLGIIKDDFLDGQYKPRRMVELARENLDADWRDIKDMTYGFRNHPWTNELISASEFGTAVHKRIEEIIKDGSGENATPWDDWALPFVEWVSEKKIEVLGTEYVVGCDYLKIAGSVDFIGRDPKDGRIFLADYKTRKCKGRGKYYSKDCKQLAIESLMLSNLLKLDYLPECLSVCICTDTAKHFHKKWKDKYVQQGIRSASLAAKIYWEDRMTKP